MSLRPLTASEKRWVRALVDRGLTRDSAVHLVQKNTQLRRGLPRATCLYPQEKLREARLHWREPVLPGRYTHEDFRRWMRVGWNFGFPGWTAAPLP
jgi:hypothetical protein